MIFASHHLSARHALSLRLRSWLELIDLAFYSLPSLPSAEQSDRGGAEFLGHHRLFAGKLWESQGWKGSSRLAQGPDEETEASQAAVTRPRSRGDGGVELQDGFLVFSPPRPQIFHPLVGSCLLPREEGVPGIGECISVELCRANKSAWQWGGAQRDKLGNQTEPSWIQTPPLTPMGSHQPIQVSATPPARWQRNPPKGGGKDWIWCLGNTELKACRWQGNNESDWLPVLPCSALLPSPGFSWFSSRPLRPTLFSRTTAVETLLKEPAKGESWMPFSTAKSVVQRRYLNCQRWKRQRWKRLLSSPEHKWSQAPGAPRPRLVSSL